MKALTICQPYAELIARGDKRVRGPTPFADDDYIGWSESMIQSEVDRLNAVFEAGRVSVTSTPSQT